MYSKAWQLATVYACMPSDYTSKQNVSWNLFFSNWLLDWKLTDWILIKRDSILLLNNRFTVYFFRQRKEYFTIWMNGLCQTPEISFSQQGQNTSNKKQLASDLPTHAETQNFYLKKNNQTWAMRQWNFDKLLFWLKKEHFTVWMNVLFISRDIFGTLQTINISQVTCRCMVI